MGCVAENLSTTTNMNLRFISLLYQLLGMHTPAPIAAQSVQVQKGRSAFTLAT